MVKKLLALSSLKISIAISFFITGLFIYNLTTYDPQGSFLNLIDKKWVDFVVKERGTQPHSSAVIIVAIDTLSVDRYGRWPWPRRRIAELVKVLNEHYEVGVIGFDIVFSEPEQDGSQVLTSEYRKAFSQLKVSKRAEGRRFIRYLEQRSREMDGDTLLGDELSKKKNSVLGYLFFTNTIGLEHLSKEDKNRAAQLIAGSQVSLVIGEIAEGMIPVGYAPEANIGKIYQGGTFSGFFNMHPDVEDGTVRRVHLLTRYGKEIYPSLDLQILRVFLNAENIVVETDPHAGTVSSISLGEKLIVPDKDGSILLNYKGPEKTFPHYSVVDIIERKVSKEELQGKIVLVGATEPGIFDLRTSPVGAAYPGVEVHATLLDNLLTDTYFQITASNHIISIFLMLFFGVLLGVLLPRLKGIYAAAFTLFLLLGYVLILRWMVENVFTWSSAVYVGLVIISCWAGVTLYQFLVADKDKRFIRSAFQQYLAPEVIRNLIANPDTLKLGGERREMTAFFSDIAGFSAFSEKLSAEQLVRLVNQYLTGMSNVIMAYSGTVDKYEGDAIIAFFGAPIHYENHAARACLATLDMRDELDRLGEILQAEGLPTIRHRIGVNTGEMVVGNMGSEKRFDYTIMGNEVNVTSRLEGANKVYGTDSIISESTYNSAKDTIEARELDLVRVVNINTPIRIYELLAKKGDLGEAQQKGMACFAQGLAYYRQQKWDEAIAQFESALRLLPQDRPSQVFLDRCQDFKITPPLAEEGEPWDGVYTTDSK